jgi:hypothetical protein
MSETEKWAFIKRRFLLSEGSHDKDFLTCLIRARKLPTFQVRHAAECNEKEVKGRKIRVGGRPGFAPSIEGFPAISGFDRLKGIGLITDNDDTNSLRQLITSLRRIEGFKPSGDFPVLGTIEGKKVFVVFIPNKGEYGNLEKLCLPALHFLWPKARACVETYLDCVGAKDWGKKNEIYKAETRCIISGFNEKDAYKGLGQICQNKEFPMDLPCFDELAKTLSFFDEIIAGK